MTWSNSTTGGQTRNDLSCQWIQLLQPADPRSQEPSVDKPIGPDTQNTPPRHLGWPSSFLQELSAGDDGGTTIFRTGIPQQQCTPTRLMPVVPPIPRDKNTSRKLGETHLEHECQPCGVNLDKLTRVNGKKKLSSLSSPSDPNLISPPKRDLQID